MTPEAIAERVRDKLGDGVETHVAYGQVWVTVGAQALPDVARLCKEDPELACDFFDFLSAVDRRDDGFEVVAHVYSLRHRHHVTLRALADGGRDAPRVPTLTGVYRGANWHERETWDMFGIEFEGHPGLAPRILTAENFEGWPLRKDFLLSTREAKPWPGAKEPTEPPQEGGDGEVASVPAESAEGQGVQGGPGSPEDRGVQGGPGSPEDKAAAAKERAERAKRKAAEMRAKKARERADAQAAAADETGGGDTEGAAAAQVAAAAGEPEPQTPEGTTEVAPDDITMDAAAGTIAGDTSEPPTQDAPGAERPVEDREAEARAGEGGPPRPGGSPGVTSEGRHADEPEDVPSESAGSDEEGERS